jgi:uncharacterized protein
MNYKRLLRRSLRTLGVLTLLFCLFAAWAVEYALPYWPIKPLRRNPAEMTAQLPLGYRPEQYGLQAETWQVHTPDSILLSAFYLPARTRANGKTLLLLHGISNCKESFLPRAAELTTQGYNVLLTDLRAHGQSGGDYNTFGYRETRDISALLDTLDARHPGTKVGILGQSLGGAIALQCLANDKRLQFGIIESTFHALPAVIEQYGVNYFGIRSEWLARHTLDKSAEIARYDPYSILPVKAAERITQPMFISHGDADERIPLAFGRQNFEHLASADKTWYAVPGARHSTLYHDGGEAYKQAVQAFLDKQ